MPIEVPRGGKMDWAPLREKIAKQGMRNSNVLAIAPTATISNIMGTTPCIEPNYKNLFVKSNLSGEFIVLNPYLVRDLKEAACGAGDVGTAQVLSTASSSDIDGDPGGPREALPDRLRHRLRMDHRRRRPPPEVDRPDPVVNLFLAEPDMKTLSHMYRRAWRAGLKTTYYLRTLGASNIEGDGVARLPLK